MSREMRNGLFVSLALRKTACNNAFSFGIQVEVLPEMYRHKSLVGDWLLVLPVCRPYGTEKKSGCLPPRDLASMPFQK